MSTILHTFFHRKFGYLKSLKEVKTMLQLYEKVRKTIVDLSYKWFKAKINKDSHVSLYHDKQKHNDQISPTKLTTE